MKIYIDQTDHYKKLGIKTEIVGGHCKRFLWSRSVESCPENCSFFAFTINDNMSRLLIVMYGGCSV